VSHMVGEGAGDDGAHSCAQGVAQKRIFAPPELLHHLHGVEGLHVDKRIELIVGVRVGIGVSILKLSFS
jgi:hypothetical protein